MKKRTLLIGLLSACLALTSAFAIVGCNNANNSSNTSKPTQIEQVYAQYVVYAQAEGVEPLSYEEWLATIKGEKGDKGEKGETGADGKSAYQIWLDAGNDGTEEDFLNWLKGENGATGVGIKKVEYDENGDLKITFTDDTEQTIVLPNKHAHVFGEWIMASASTVHCENRMYYHICSTCNAVEWEKGSDADHKWTTVTTDPTCTDQGYDTKSCSLCGFSEVANYQPELGHSLSTEYSYNRHAHWFACDTCGDYIEIENHQKVSGECIICHTTTLIPSILLIERNEGESDNLKDLLESSGEGVEIDTLHILVDDMPTTAFELCAYDEVILVNIANADMPENFDIILQEYVYDFGGSMLTVGGNKSDTWDIVPNAYNRKDMYGTLYQEMLPVQAIDYTPPTGVVFIIDTSASMTQMGQNATYFEHAKESLLVGLDSLTERDFVGIVTLNDSASVALPMTACTQREKILSAINGLNVGGGGTLFSPALECAGSALSGLANVQIRRVILITDGYPGEDYEAYASVMEHYYEKAGITYSMIILNELPHSEKDRLKDATERSGGYFYEARDVNHVPTLLREALMTVEIKEINYEPFTPTIASDSSIVSGINQANIPMLEGFYGTKLKDGATAILTGIYDVPIYAQWDYGNGKVGSFMCDLNMVWSQDFMSDRTGQQLILNIVYSLMEYPLKTLSL